MAIPLANLNGHLTRLVSDLPVKCRFNGFGFDGAKTTPDLSLTLEIGGADLTAGFQVFVKADALPNPKPALGSVIEIDGTKMKVMHIRSSPDAGQLIAYQMGFARGL